MAKSLAKLILYLLGIPVRPPMVHVEKKKDPSEPTDLYKEKHVRYLSDTAIISKKLKLTGREQLSNRCNRDLALGLISL